MQNRIEQAVANHKKGYNCAQAVVCAYCDLFGVEQDVAFKLSEGFGGGMGAMRDGVCGAVTATYMLAGLQGSSGGVENGITKAATYQKVRELCQAFKEKNKSVICKALKGQESPDIFRSCDGCIEDAARLVETMLLSEKTEELEKEN